MARPKLKLQWVHTGFDPMWDQDPAEFIEKLNSCIDENKTIDVLEVSLGDEDGDLSEPVQNLILNKLFQNDNQIITKLLVHTCCENEDNSNAGLDFFIQCLEASRNITIKAVKYRTFEMFPMTLNDSTRLARAISNSNDALRSLSISFLNHDDGKHIFSNENTLENIFIAVLDRGLQSFRINSDYGQRNEMFQRVCSAGNSQLATNTTLQELWFLNPPQRGDQNEEELHRDIFSDEQINLLSTILKTNTGLTNILFDRNLYNVSDQGRADLFRALRCNSTLTGRLSFDGLPLSDDNHPRSIEEHIKLNKWWQSFKSKYNIGINKTKKKTTTTTIGTGTIGNAVQGQPNAQPKSLAVSLYPYLIMNKLCLKPQFLYEFLRSETPTLVGAATTTATSQHHP